MQVLFLEKFLSLLYNIVYFFVKLFLTYLYNDGIIDT